MVIRCCQIGRVLVLAALVVISTAMFASVVAHDSTASRMFELGAAGCPSGHSVARLTGWTLNNESPKGTATYAEAAKRLEVIVSSVGLPDGTRLSVFDGEDRIGDMDPLKSGEAKASLVATLRDEARIRILDNDRPILSANLRCVTAPAPVPTVTPSPAPTTSPSPSASPSPSPSASPSPTELPTPDPMPKPSPAPSPSPR